MRRCCHKNNCLWASAGEHVTLKLTYDEGSEPSCV
ncbi:hypothetical protein LM010_12345 [Lacticaseibacillus manihotivorans]|uniref:Uncharacterized protein n=1 Tax=Lacticaseibacillus manihotivorans TaxID=88233 RepID=A0A5P8JVE2_9LACO|nr:hypothetical protein LM010_12345 [Lacticaseibacillus manihotivorans]